MTTDALRGTPRAFDPRIHVRGIARLHFGPDPCEEVLVEADVFLEVGPRHDRAVAGDDGIDVLDSSRCLGQRDADLSSFGEIGWCWDGHSCPSPLILDL